MKYDYEILDQTKRRLFLLLGISFSVYLVFLFLLLSPSPFTPGYTASVFIFPQLLFAWLTIKGYKRAHGAWKTGQLLFLILVLMASLGFFIKGDYGFGSLSLFGAIISFTFGIYLINRKSAKTYVKTIREANKNRPIEALIDEIGQ